MTTMTKTTVSCCFVWHRLKIWAWWKTIAELRKPETKQRHQVDSRKRSVGRVHDRVVLDNRDAGAKRRFNVDAGDVVCRSRVKLLQPILQVRLPLLENLVNRIHQRRAHWKFYHNNIQEQLHFWFTQYWSRVICHSYSDTVGFATGKACHVIKFSHIWINRCNLRSDRITVVMQATASLK